MTSNAVSHNSRPQSSASGPFSPGKGHPGGVGNLRLVAWEVTRSCNLACLHCRAAAQDRPYENELKTEECFQLLDNIATFAQPIVILTGGEPLLRPDIFDIAAYGNQKGFRMTMAVNGTLEIGRASCRERV